MGGGDLSGISVSSSNISVIQSIYHFLLDHLKTPLFHRQSYPLKKNNREISSSYDINTKYKPSSKFQF